MSVGGCRVLLPACAVPVCCWLPFLQTAAVAAAVTAAIAAAIAATAVTAAAAVVVLKERWQVDSDGVVCQQ
jgi:hypothetical protein